MSTNNKPTFFSTNEFELVFGYFFDPSNPPDKVFLGPPKPNRKCFFCGLNESETTFKNDSHVIPEGLGNKYLFSNEECYDCNQKAGKEIENEFIKACEPYRLFSKHTGKTGQSKLKKIGIDSYFKGMTAQKPLEVVPKDDVEKIFKEEADQKLSLRIPVNTHRPISIPKELARLGFFVSPELRTPELDHLRKWINGELDILPAFYSHVWLPGGVLPSTHLGVIKYIGKYQTEGSPKFLLILSFGCITFIYHFLPNNGPLTGAWPFPTQFFQKNDYGNPVLKFELILSNDKIKDSWIEMGIQPAQKIQTNEQ